jgi:hypothetical protein
MATGSGKTIRHGPSPASATSPRRRTSPAPQADFELWQQNRSAWYAVNRVRTIAFQTAARILTFLDDGRPNGEQRPWLFPQVLREVKKLVKHDARATRTAPKPLGRPAGAGLPGDRPSQAMVTTTFRLPSPGGGTSGAVVLVPKTLSRIETRNGFEPVTLEWFPSE